MKLKVAAWNMAHWSHRNVAAQAWDYLDKEIAADITLLQEFWVETLTQRLNGMMNTAQRHTAFSFSDLKPSAWLTVTAHSPKIVLAHCGTTEAKSHG